jgi:hypothetical protein
MEKVRLFSNARRRLFVDEKTISPADIGGLVWALTRLARETGNWDWTNRIYFLLR